MSAEFCSNTCSNLAVAIMMVVPWNWIRRQTGHFMLTMHSGENHLVCWFILEILTILL